MKIEKRLFPWNIGKHPTKVVFEQCILSEVIVFGGVWNNQNPSIILTSLESEIRTLLVELLPCHWIQNMQKSNWARWFVKNPTSDRRWPANVFINWGIPYLRNRPSVLVMVISFVELDSDTILKIVWLDLTQPHKTDL